jgi:adenylate kinase
MAKTPGENFKTIDEDTRPHDLIKKEAIMVIVFLGPPGSGKGTQAVLLAHGRECLHISTGDLLRDAMKSGTHLGKEAAHYIDQGELVPDDLVSGLVAERITHNSGIVLLDGYPRNISQANDLDGIVQRASQDLAAVLLFEVPVEELVNRLAGRGRTDDTPETVLQRFAVYQAETSPLIEFYGKRGILFHVAGVGSVEEIHTRVMSVFHSLS